MSITTIRKRDGRMVGFDITKIENAIAKAFIASGEIDARDVSAVSRAIGLLMMSGMPDGDVVPEVECIQDRVESALMKAGYPKTAKSYILYRSQHQKVRETKQTLLDYKKLVDGYIGAEKDWRVKENSTVTLSVGGRRPTRAALSTCTTCPC